MFDSGSLYEAVKTSAFEVPGLLMVNKPEKPAVGLALVSMMILDDVAVPVRPLARQAASQARAAASAVAKPAARSRCPPAVVS